MNYLRQLVAISATYIPSVWMQTIGIAVESSIYSIYGFRKLNSLCELSAHEGIETAHQAPRISAISCESMSMWFTWH